MSHNGWEDDGRLWKRCSLPSITLSVCSLLAKTLETEMNTTSPCHKAVIGHCWLTNGSFYLLPLKYSYTYLLLTCIKSQCQSGCCRIKYRQSNTAIQAPCHTCLHVPPPSCSLTTSNVKRKYSVERASDPRQTDIQEETAITNITIRRENNTELYGRCRPNWRMRVRTFIHVFMYVYVCLFAYSSGKSASSVSKFSE